MAIVTTPFGTTLEETNPVALAYYRREDGYEVADSTPAASAPVSTAKASPPPSAPPVTPPVTS